MKTTAALCCLFLAGCGGAALVKTDPQSSRPLPVDSMVPCDRIAPLDRKSLGALVEKIGEAASLLKECSKKQEELSDWIKRGDK